MDISRNKFSNAMCVLFTGVLLALFCICVGRKFGIDNIVSRMIITAVYCGVVVGLAFVLNKAVKKYEDSNVNINFDKSYLISIIVASVLFIVFRLLIISDIIKVEFNTGKVYEMAKIGSDGKIFTSASTVDGIFATMLSFLFKIFGNTFFPVYLLQTLLGIGAFAMIVGAVRAIFGSFPSAICALGLAVMPLFYRNIARDSSDCLVLFMFGVIMLVSAGYKKSIEETSIKSVFSILIGLLTGIFALYSTVFILVFLIPVIVLFRCNTEMLRDRIINSVCILCGHLIGFIAPIILSAYLFERTGVDGFINSLNSHLSYRFGFRADFNFLTRLGDERGIFVLLILSVFFSVMFWRNEDDTAHIIIPYWVVLALQMIFINVNNRPAYIMIFAVCLLIIGGCGLYDLGSTESPVKVYRIDDDMQPAEITTIDDKPVSIAAAKIAASAHVETIAVAEKNEEIKIAQPENNEPVKEEPVKAEEPVGEAQPTLTPSVEDKTLDVQEEKKEEPVIVKDEQPEEIKEPVEEKKPDTEPKPERKYNTAEVRQTTDFGMNDVDFESLFSGGTIPPKSVSKDIYDDVPEEKEEVTEDTVETSESTEQESVQNSEATILEEDESVRRDNSKDQKAYVDSFFGYLYDEPSQETAVEEPVTPEKEKYVSHASNFADLDLDLGFDAFDNMNVSPVEESTSQTDTVENTAIDEVTKAAEPVVEEISTAVEVETPAASENEFKFEEEIKEEPVKADDFSIDEFETDGKREIENIESEFVFDFAPKQNDYIKSWDSIEKTDTFVTDELEVFKALSEVDNIKDESAKDKAVLIDEEFEGSETEAFFNEETTQENEEEFSLEEMLDKKIDEDFSYEDALKNKIEDEEIQKHIGFSYEEALQKKLDVEQSILDAKNKNEFSFEDALNEKIVTEESINTADQLGDISYVKAVEQKMAVEDGIKNNISDNAFSFQEAIEQKLDVERSIEKAQNQEALAEFEAEHLITEDDFDFSGKNIGEEFSFEETKPLEETKAVEGSSVLEEMNFEDTASTEGSKLFDETPVVEEFKAFEETPIVEEFKAFEETPVVEEFKAFEETPIVEEFKAFEETPIVEEFKAFEETPIVDEPKTLTEETVSDQTATAEDKALQKEAVKAEEKSDEKPEEEKVELIENPLPLPKKHVHREMDYGRSIPEAWMHYDVELDSRNDHYDI
ncbi:MAG: hypothetical protein J5525_10895 [Lachnospiraceae bacterium]|nr:hypothetical protein [Lachnospiraceae bacterium]